MDKLKRIQKGKIPLELTSSWYAGIKSFFSRIARQSLKLSSNFTKISRFPYHVWVDIIVVIPVVVLIAMGGLSHLRCVASVLILFSCYISYFRVVGGIIE